MVSLFAKNLICFIVILTLCAGLGHGKEAKLPGERTTKMTFYFHDINTGKNKSVVMVVPPPKGYPNFFGSFFVIDDALTEGQELESPRIGSASGIYVPSGLINVRLMMSMVLVFESGKYNGSTLSVLASNPALTSPREFPIVGGTGVFRLARGYIVANTHSNNLKTGDATVRYEATVLHPH